QTPPGGYMGASGNSESTTRMDARESIAERRFRRRLLSEVELADFMAIMMVLATALSAYATWRTSSIANAIYLASERAYFGIESATLDDSQPGDPRVTVDYRNFGNVSGTNVKLLRRLFIDGAEVKSSTKISTPGILSPEAPHLLYIHIPPSAYAAIKAGKSSLEIQIAAKYTNLRLQPLCYMAHRVFDAREKDFDVNGGTLDCAALRGLWPDDK
ncbi:MAG: hypothetical protein ACREQT_02985, partial [Candidatus Binataceae bacterium]